jgi:hypothetical protein
MRRRSAILAVCLLAGAASLSSQSSQDDEVTLALTLLRGGFYITDFLQKFSNVVSEETYIQDSNSPLQSAVLPNVRGLSNNPGAMTTGVRYRVLKSDFLLVSVNGAPVPFRDVFEIDAKPVRDRDSRLSKLFLSPSEKAMEQVKRIQDESARYNIGNMRRTVNSPVLALVVLQAEYQDRFSYTLGKQDPKVGPNVRIIDYKEVASPSFVRGRSDLDLFAHGRLWIEEDTGRLMKTEVLLEQPNLRARVTTSFRLDDRFGIAVPYEMQEEYKFDNGTRVTAVATYDRFRRFDVSTDESLKDGATKETAPKDQVTE